MSPSTKAKAKIVPTVANVKFGFVSTAFFFLSLQKSRYCHKKKSIPKKENKPNNPTPPTPGEESLTT